MTGKTRFSILIAIILIAVVGYAFMEGSGTDLIANKSKQDSGSSADSDEAKKFQAPDFALQNLEGEQVRLSDYKGKVVFINFWATWCGPCRHEVPAFIELQNEYGADNLAILGISVDQGDLSVVKEFAEEYGINYEVLYATPEVTAMYGGIRSIPTTFVVDRDGFLRDGRVGFPGKEYFQQVINALL